MLKISSGGAYKRVSQGSGVSEIVSGIIDDVKMHGDEALIRLTEKFDGVSLTSLELTGWREHIACEPEFIEILEEAAQNIRDYHARQARHGYIINEKRGVILGQKVLPLERVGIYIPGGTASYPSSVLMNVIPAKIAGVKEIIMITPPDKAGGVKPMILAAANIAGVDRVFLSGGAQAIAAMAYGTQSVPRVDKITGPGNAFVAEAKRQVYGAVDIDMIAGPSEILIIADDSASPRFIAADMLSQAEHGADSAAILITDSKALAEAVAQEVEAQLNALERCDIACKSIDNNGRIILVDELIEAVSISNDIAPEHLEICTQSPFDLLDLVKNAGSVFLGSYAPEALGDYFSGTNHTLPTGGAARFSSPLSVDDFVKKSCFTYYTKDAFNKVAEKVAAFADKEGLTAHAKAARVRLMEGMSND